jgi:hypothetical protein
MLLCFEVEGDRLGGVDATLGRQNVSRRGLKGDSFWRSRDDKRDILEVWGL